MKTIIISSRKGGAGKTTLSVNLATQACLDGQKKVALLDLDPQGSSQFWASLRNGDFPTVIKAGTADLSAKLAKLQREGFDYVFLDMPPTDQKGIREALGKADLVVIPTKPSPLDIHSASSTLEWAADAGSHVAWVINGASVVSKNPEIVFGLLKATKVPVFKTIVHERSDFVNSVSRGQSAAEFAPSSKAADEVRDLWRELRNMLAKI